MKKIFETIERELKDVKSEFLSQLADFFTNIESFDEQYYMHVDLDRLVIYSVNYLEKNHIEPTYEKIVMTAYRLFPRKFALPGFEKFPDGKRVYDSLGHCTSKDRMWLNGNIKSGFHMTDKGKYFFEETEKLLRGEETKRGYVSTPVKRKETFFILKMKKTPAFKKFANDDADDISEEEVKEALMGTRSTSKETLQKNWDLLMDYAQIQQERRVLLFLKLLKSRLREIV